MRPSRVLLPAICLVATSLLMAQTAPERIQTGFKSLSTGSWETALKEWNRDGIWTDAEGKLLGKLEEWIPAPRSVGRWEAANPPYLTTMWQRHWVLVSFDQGALFFVFDYVHHKGQWRLVALHASKDPSEVLPHLDLMPVLSTRSGS